MLIFAFLFFLAVSCLYFSFGHGGAAFLFGFLSILSLMGWLLGWDNDDLL